MRVAGGAAGSGTKRGLLHSLNVLLAWSSAVATMGGSVAVLGMGQGTGGLGVRLHGGLSAWV